MRCGRSFCAEDARLATRTPAGHPEGYLEAFASIYKDFIADIRRVARGEAAHRNYPGAQDGLRGLRFIQAAVSSSERGASWVDI